MGRIREINGDGEKIRSKKRKKEFIIQQGYVVKRRMSLLELYDLGTMQVLNSYRGHATNHISGTYSPIQ